MSERSYSNKQRQSFRSIDIVNDDGFGIGTPDSRFMSRSSTANKEDTISEESDDGTSIQKSSAYRSQTPTMAEIRQMCPTKDSNNVGAYLAFLYGFAVVSPYNFIILTLPYLSGVMPDYPIEYVVTFAVNGVMVLVIIFSLAKPQIGSHATKINLSILVAALLTLLLPLVSKVSPGQATTFWVTIALMFLIGVAMGAALAQTLSYMSLMPERYMALNSMGIGFSGLTSLVLYAVLLLCFDTDHEFERVMTFYSLCFILLSGISALFIIERRSDFCQYYIQIAQECKVTGANNLCDKFKVPLSLAWKMLFQVFFGIALSMICLPGVLVAVPITFIKSDDWFNLFIIGLFNSFDFTGRTLGGIESLQISIKRPFWLHGFAFSRIAFVILAILIEIGLFDDSLGLQDWLIILNPIFLAVTNGYVQTIFSCYASSIVSNAELDDEYILALGSLIAVSLTMGISTGGLL